MSVEPERRPDDSPVLYVHPDDVDLAEMKGNFAELGVSVKTSPRVQRGQSYLHDPKGRMRRG